MDNYKTIDSSIIDANVNIGELITSLKVSYAKDLRRWTITPDKIQEIKEDPFSGYIAMSSVNEELGLFITKVATILGKKRDKSGCSSSESTTIHAVVTVFSTNSGKLLAIIDGAALTNIKCAAVTGFVTDACTRPEANSLSVIGTGNLAREQVKGVAAVRNVKTVTVYDCDQYKAKEFIKQLNSFLNKKVEINTAANIPEAVENKDIICTATTSVKPLITSDSFFSKNVHVNCMGAHTPESREIAHEILEKSLLIVEDRETAIKEAGLLHKNAIEFEEMLTLDPDALFNQRTIFSSTGHAFLDLISSNYVLKDLNIL
ncbi:MAG: hypothetical protein K9M56_09090 [Victivallales bacterium]|nr:hypothetical protein [Victivallales bacterium]